MRFNAPPIGLTLLLIVVTVSCTALGFWQVRRNTEKKALIAEWNEQLDSEAVGVEALNQSDLVYRRIGLTGRWDPEHTFFVHREPNELRAGVRLLSPLILDEPVAGFEAVLVDRGWIPHSAIEDILASTESRPEAAVMGMVSPLPLRGQRPGTETLRPEWTYFQSLRHGPHVQRSLPYPLAPYMVIAGEDGDEEPPHGGYSRPHSVVNHVAYAVTWFTMALAAAGLWVGLGFERGKRGAAD